MTITSNKTYEPGDRVICIISSNSNLEFNREYIVKGDTGGEITLEGENGYTFNVARFISIKEIRETKINKILK